MLLVFQFLSQKVPWMTYMLHNDVMHGMKIISFSLLAYVVL